LVFGLRDVMNFAHGAMFMLGAYLGYSVAGLFNFWIALIIVPALLAAVGVAFEYGAIRPLRNRARMDVALLTFGFALILSQLVIKAWGTAPLEVSAPPSLAGSVDLFGRPYPAYRLFLIAVGFGACLALALWLRFTRIGMHVRAVSRAPEISRILGVNTDRLGLLVVCLGTAYAGFAGVLAGPYLSVDPALGGNVLISCLIVVVIGGLGSIAGAIAASVAYGLIEVMGSLVSPVIAVTAPYLLLVFILLWRPQGFGQGRVD
jgi:branched-chain amino acid transport system permease protein